MASARCDRARAGEVEHFGAPRFRGHRADPPDQIAASRLGHQREHQVAVRIEVVDGHEQLAKPRLADVVGEEIDIAPREIRRRRLPRAPPRPAAGPTTIASCAPRPRATTAANPRRATRTGRADAAASRRAASLSPRRARPRPGRAPRAAAARSGMPSGANSCCVRRTYATREAAGATEAEHAHDEIDREHQRAGRDRRQRDRHDEHREHRPPRTRGARRDARRTGIRRRPTARSPSRSTGSAPPSMAANSADTAPMPRPATMSSLTPASCRARRTPA